MTTIKWPQAHFPITSSSLLKLADFVMHGSETWYICVFQHFRDNHEQKMASGPFPCNYFIFQTPLIKLANHAGEIFSQVYLSVSMMATSLRHSISIIHVL